MTTDDQIEVLRREKAALEKRIADIEDDFKATMAEACGMSEGGYVSQHCSCVPHLRRRIREGDSENHVVRRVVRDGSGGLWTEVNGHGMAMTTRLAAACLGPVVPHHKREGTLESLAAAVHDVWCRWMAWQFRHANLVTRQGTCEAFKENKDEIYRWDRLSVMPYEKLTEKEKVSARAIADEYLAIVLGQEKS